MISIFTKGERKFKLTSAIGGTKLEKGPKCPLVFIPFVINYLMTTLSNVAFWLHA